MSKETVKSSTCYACPLGACFIKVHLKDGKIVKVTNDPEKVSVNNCRRGFLDNDGRMGIEYHYGEKRINYPLKRAGKRGENKWERISWDQALDEIAAKLKALKDNYGPHCVSSATGTAHHSDNNWVPWRWLVGFGSVNKIGNEQICYGAQFITSEHSLGWPASPYPPPGVVPQSIILIGNSHESAPNAWETLGELQKSGIMKFIVVDPRMTEAARRADHWLQIRPGTDIALWMSWTKLIIENEWFDREFVEDWTNAPFLVRSDNGKMLRAEDVVDNVPRDAFVVWNTKTNAPAIWNADDRKYLEEDIEKALVGSYSIKLKDGTGVECKTAWTLLTERVDEWTPEKAAEVTNLKVSDILTTCEVYAKSEPALFITGGHVYDSFAPGSSSVYRIRDILRSICGNIDRGEMVTGCYDPKKIVSIYEMELKPDEAFSEEDKKKQPGWDHGRALTFQGYDLKAKYEKKHWGVASNAMYSNQGHHHIMWQDMIDEKPDRTRAMIINGSNPMVKYSNVKRVYEAMKKLDLIVSLEFTMTPSAVIGDYVLPMADWFERAEIGPSTPCDIFNFIHMTDAVVPPLYERRTDYDVFKGLAERLGFGDDWKWKDLTECYNWRAQGLLEEYGCKDIGEFGEKYGADYPENVYENYKNVNGFATPSGKMEVWSLILEELRYDPIPQYYEPALSPLNAPELTEKYPLTLIGIDRHAPNYHTMFFEVPSCRKMTPEPIMQIHYDTARRMNPPIANGDWVWIETRRGRIRQRAQLSWGIELDVVKTQHHWWFPEMPGEEPYLHGVWESNTNVLTEDDPELCDPVFMTWPHNALPCKVYKVADTQHLEEDSTRSKGE